MRAAITVPALLLLAGGPAMAAVGEAGGRLPYLPGLFGAVALVLGAGVLYRDSLRARQRSTRLAEEAAALAVAYRELETAKTRAEAKMAVVEATLSGMSDGLMMLDGNLRLVQWNRRFAQFTGVPEDMLRVGTPMEEMLRAQAAGGEFGAMASPEDLEAEVKRRLGLLHSFRSVGVAERVRPNGQALEVRRSQLPDGGFVTLYTDITARRRAEAAQREARRVSEAATRQKEEFVAMVSHEIRAPLNVVISSLALLGESGLDPHQLHLAATARHSGDMLLDMIDDILDLSRMDAGRLRLRPLEFALAPLLYAVADMFRPSAARRDITLAVEIGDVPATLFADAVRIRQILVNFVSNAVKFSQPGVVTIGVNLIADPAEPGGQRLRFAVRDQGPRIPLLQAAQLFQPFARLDYARTAGTPGTGLGLAICERLARLMGGTIGLSATATPTGGPIGAEAGAQGEGNEFWFTLKAHPPAAAAFAAFGSGQARRARVLLVEDVAVNSLLTAALLRREGHHVEMVATGLEAVHMAATLPFDVVLMDLKMPGIDGIQAAGRIRALPGPGGRTAIIALTGSLSDSDAAACAEAAMNGILTKPVRPAELFAAIGQALAWPGPASPVIPPAPPRAVPLVDPERLADLQRDLPPGLFATLAEQCLADLRDRLAPLRTAVAAGEFAQMGELAHALAGMAGSYGLSAVERRMRLLMQASVAQDAAAAAAAMPGLESELDRSADLLRAILRARAA